MNKEYTKPDHCPISIESWIKDGYCLIFAMKQDAGEKQCTFPDSECME